jgi:hypothetical protein
MAAEFSPIFERIRATPGMKVASRRIMGIEGNLRSLYRLLLSCQDSQSSDPRDKIYALIPLAEGIPKDGIQIDYSLTLFELKLQVALHYIVKNGYHLEFILRFCRLLDRMICSPDDEEQSQAIEPVFSTRNSMMAEIRRVLEDRDHFYSFTLDVDRRVDQNDGIFSTSEVMHFDNFGIYHNFVGILYV